MKRVIFLTNNFSFYDEIGAGPASRQIYHVRHLAAHGYQVEVIAPSVDNLSRRIPEKYASQNIVREIYPGFTLHRTKAFANFGDSIGERLRNALSFAYYAGLTGSRINSPDIVFATSPTIFVAFIGWFLSKMKRRPFILEVRDLWTESIRASGYLSLRWLAWVFRLMEKKLYRDAARIIAVTPGIQQAICGDLPGQAHKVALVPNGIDFQLLPPEDQPVEIPEAIKKPKGAFLCMYAGRHARYNGLENILATAELLQSDPRFRFVLIGDGYRKASLVALAAQKKLANVSFLDPVAKNDIYRYLAAADLFLLPYRNDAIFRTALPNKLFDYMACGRPTVAMVPWGDTSRVLAEAGCGVTVPPDQPQLLAETIRDLAAKPELLAQMGERGKDYVHRHFNRQDLGDRLVAAFEEVLHLRFPGKPDDRRTGLAGPGFSEPMGGADAETDSKQHLAFSQG